jgi:hypothetical protein
MLSRHVTLPSHRFKTCSLPSLYLSVMLRPVTSPLKLKLKHLIHTTAVGHPLWTV